VALDAEIDHYTAIFLEKGKNQLLTSGKFDTELAATYFGSNFYLQKIDEWPISFQMQKLRIDEAIHYYLGDSAHAAIAAERLLELCKRIETIRQIRSEDDAKCMFRLSNYYSEIGNKSKVLEVISTFRVLAKSDSTFNFTYLRRFVYTLLNASMVFSLPELANEGIQSWHEQRGIIDAMPKDALRFETMIYVCAHHLSIGNVLEAREVLNQALEIAPNFPYLTWQVVLKILHLMVLLDENDERGLLSFGKNYKRHLRATLKLEDGSTVALAGLEVILILAKESNLDGREKLQGSARKLLERLLEFEQMNEITLKPWSYAMKKWAGLQLKK
jgi:tetratricopeptide (TPR) repeat protein